MTDPKALATVEAAPLARSSDAFVDFLERAARDPTIDVDKLERLLALKERQDAIERERQYADAMAQVQAVLKQVTKSGLMTGTDRKYARLEDIDMQIRPLLAEHGFSVSYNSEDAPKGTKYTCTIRHAAGFSETKSLTLPVDSGAGRNAVQSVGSTTSYARRYLLEMHLNLVKRDEDDDGNGGQRCITPEQAKQLREALASVKADEGKFLRIYGAGSIEEMLADNFAAAMRFVEEKRRSK